MDGTKPSTSSETSALDERENTFSLPLNKPLLGRIFHPPKLERKHSSGDLHSRLKTRKILGVGETDNGDIHRSKISQVLGHNDHLYVKLPKGYHIWQSFLSLLMAGQAALIVLFPATASNFGLIGMSSDAAANSITSLYYASSLIAISVLLWRINMNDKAVARSIQTGALFYFVASFLADFLHTISTDGFGSVFRTPMLLVCGLRIAMGAVCVMYLKRMGAPSSGLRRSPSYKDMSDM